MAKLKKDPITAQDLTDFVNADSDFGFEINHAWSAPGGHLAGEVSYRLSHIEIVTFDAVTETTTAWLGAAGFLPVRT